jgi:hypothetical protein
MASLSPRLPIPYSIPSTAIAGNDLEITLFLFFRVYSKIPVPSVSPVA